MSRPDDINPLVLDAFRPLIAACERQAAARALRAAADAVTRELGDVGDDFADLVSRWLEHRAWLIAERVLPTHGGEQR